MAKVLQYKIRRYSVALAPVFLGVFFGIVITQAIQERDDRGRVAEIERTSAELKVHGCPDRRNQRRQSYYDICKAITIKRCRNMWISVTWLDSKMFSEG